METKNNANELVELNLAGILSMIKGDHLDAISYFHQGLKIVLLGLNASEKEGVEGRTPLKKRKLSRAKEAEGGEGSRVLFSVALNNHDAEEHDDVFVLFNRALHFSSGLQHMEHLDVGFIYHVMTVALLYNTGLAHHLLGLQKCNCAVLSKASYYYALTYNTLAEFSAKNVEYQSSDYNYLFDLAYLAAKNNLGHLHAYCRNFAEVDVCSDELAFRLGDGAKSSVDNRSLLLEEERKVFLLNICFFREMILTTAPSA